jgi:hypothetical protein
LTATGGYLGCRRRAVLAREDWKEAPRHLRIYPSKHSDDQDVLLKHAQANLRIRPRTQSSTTCAIAARIRGCGPVACARGSDQGTKPRTVI